MFSSVAIHIRLVAYLHVKRQCYYNELHSQDHSFFEVEVVLADLVQLEVWLRNGEKKWMCCFGEPKLVLMKHMRHRAITTIMSSGMEGEKTIIIGKLGMLYPMFVVFYKFCEQTYIHIHTHTHTYTYTYRYTNRHTI